jgi:hypothetical protein
MTGVSRPAIGIVCSEAARSPWSRSSTHWMQEVIERRWRASGALRGAHSTVCVQKDRDANSKRLHRD